MTLAAYPQVEQGIISALLNDPNITAVIADRVYAVPVPPTVPLPFIGFRYVSGGYVHDSARLALDVHYRLDFVAATMADAEEGAALIYDALKAATLTIPQWQHYATDIGGKLVMVDLKPATPRYQVGLFFRFRAATEG